MKYKLVVKLHQADLSDKINLLLKKVGNFMVILFMTRLKLPIVKL